MAEFVRFTLDNGSAGRSEAFAAAMRPAAKAFSHTCAVRGFVFGVAARNLSQVV